MIYELSKLNQRNVKADIFNLADVTHLFVGIIGILRENRISNIAIRLRFRQSVGYVIQILLFHAGKLIPVSGLDDQFNNRFDEGTNNP